MAEYSDSGVVNYFYSGFTKDHPVSERLQEVVNTWSWYTGTDQIHDDSEVKFRCGECKFGMHAETNKTRLAHLVTFHGYNYDGTIRNGDVPCQ